MIHPLAASSAGNAAGVALVIVLIVLSAAAWLTPIFVVLYRKAPNVAQVVVVDLLLGWTGVGWVVALVMALKPLPPPYPPPYGPGIR